MAAEIAAVLGVVVCAHHFKEHPVLIVKTSGVTASG